MLLRPLSITSRIRPYINEVRFKKLLAQPKWLESQSQSIMLTSFHTFPANNNSTSTTFTITNISSLSHKHTPNIASNPSRSTIILRHKHSKKKKMKNQKPKIEITQTSANNNNNNNSPSSSSPPPIIKPNDQIKEEEIRDLQAEIAFHHQHAQYNEALKVSRKLLERSQAHFGNSHPVTASSYNNIGLMQKYLGHFQEAKEMYYEALRIYADCVGKDHASYAATLNNLGNLLRSQSLMSYDVENDNDNDNDAAAAGGGDSVTNQSNSLSAMERLQLNEMAIEYFEEALLIRQEELGKTHPHTITSHSNLGAAMASMLLQEQANRIQSQKTINDGRHDINNNSNDTTTTTTTSIAPLKTSKFTKTRWKAAEEHLRTALNTAVQNPRGKQIDLIKSSSSESHENKNNQSVARLTPPLISPNQPSLLQIQTLSAAGAAQNLAVFLKTKADILGQNNNNNHIRQNNNITDLSISKNEMMDMYAEAINLYHGALHVRTELLSPSHPDTIATKFSLAEVLVAAHNDEEGANKLRQEILDVYSVEEREEETKKG